jgi:hypothetical protein
MLLSTTKDGQEGERFVDHTSAPAPKSASTSARFSFTNISNAVLNFFSDFGVVGGADFGVAGGADFSADFEGSGGGGSAVAARDFFTEDVGFASSTDAAASTVFLFFPDVVTESDFFFVSVEVDSFSAASSSKYSNSLRICQTF